MQSANPFPNTASNFLRQGCTMPGLIQRFDDAIRRKSKHFTASRTIAVAVQIADLYRSTSRNRMRDEIGLTWPFKAHTVSALHFLIVAVNPGFF